MAEQKQKKATEAQDEELFGALAKAKKKKKHRTVRIVVITLVIVAVLLTCGVLYLRHKVRTEFSSDTDEVQSYAATVGSISTTVSGSGTLANVDTEALTVPDGVEVTEVSVSTGDSVAEGTVLAPVNLSSVMSAMSDIQSQIDDLDDEIADAADDTVSSSVTCGVAGRVKLIYAAKGDNVANCMYQNGALAVLSLDGYMAAEIDAGSLQAGDSVTVVREDGTGISGTVESVSSGKAVVLVTDNGPKYDETVTVKDTVGTELGTAQLTIHDPLRVTAIAGTISSVRVSENAKVSASTVIFYLTDTSYSANYETLLEEREDLEDTLVELMKLYRDGALLAPYDGIVCSVDYAASGDTDIVTFAPAENMCVTISVDEADILSLEVGQTADVTVSSIGDDSFTGTVTEIDTTATSSSGVTRYSAVVTVPRDAQMLSGMTASVTIRIQGVDDAVLIPVDALHQTSSTSYVYTSYDEETGEYGGLVEVTTGISNSNYVEITSGLSEGDTVYYTESQAEFSMGDFDFSGFGGSGDGDMPSGDMPGGFGGDSGSSGGHGGNGGNGGGMPGMPGGN